MSILVDTTVLLAVAIEKHEHHAPCLPWLSATMPSTSLYVSAHTLAELYAQLTRPRTFDLTPAETRRIIRRYERALSIVALSDSDYLDLLDEAATTGVRYGLIYDLIHAHAARKGGAELIATLNVRHFKRIWPSERIVNPIGARDDS